MVLRRKNLAQSIDRDHCGLSLGLSLFNLLQSRQRRRRRLVRAIYHHAAKAADAIRKAQEHNKSVRAQIRQQKTYVPHIPRSTADDLTYDQIIEVMELLNKEEADILLEYFHLEMALHSIAGSFDSNLTRDWRQARKLRAWGIYEDMQEKTLLYAEKTRAVFAKRR